MTVTLDQDWRLRAACRDHPLGLDAWFPGPGQSGHDAQTVCLYHCPVRADCLSWAMDVEAGREVRIRHGVVGGLTPAQRWQLEACRTGTCRHPEHGGTR